MTPAFQAIKGQAISGIDSWTETHVYGPSCAKRLGIVADKPAREKRPRKVRIARKVEIDSATADLFEGMQ